MPRRSHRKSQDSDTGKLVGRTANAAVFINDYLVVLQTSKGRLIEVSADFEIILEAFRDDTDTLKAYLRTAMDLARDSQASRRPGGGSLP